MDQPASLPVCYHVQQVWEFSVILNYDHHCPQNVQSMDFLPCLLVVFLFSKKNKKKSLGRSLGRNTNTQLYLQHVSTQATKYKLLTQYAHEMKT